MQFNNMLAIALAALLVMPIQAQEAASAASPEATGAAEQEVAEPSGLNIVVLEGEGAKNDIRSGVAVPPKVEVRDDAEKPLQGVEVIFRLPMAGASGVFSGWIKNQTVRTDEYGQASVTGYTPNDVEGRFNIKVTATAGTQTATAVVAQSNIRGAGGKASSGKKKWWILAAVAGTVAVVGGVAKTGDGGSSSTITNPVSITAGPVSITGPK